MTWNHLYYTLMMKVKRCSENSVYVYQTTLRHITETKVFIAMTAFEIVKFTKVLQTEILARKEDKSNKYEIFVKKLLGIQINHQQDATIFQFIILTFIYNLTCFGRFSAHHQELNDCSSSLWFYLLIVVTVALFSCSGRSARPRTQHDCHHDTKVKSEAATAVIELLMMGGKTSETCWAVNKLQDNKLVGDLFELYNDARTYLLTYLLTPWSRVFLEKLTSKLCS